jgi:hypothetical protein
MVVRRSSYKSLVRKPQKERDHWEDLGVDRKLLKCIFGKKGDVWSGCLWLRIWTSGGLS